MFKDFYRLAELEEKIYRILYSQEFENLLENCSIGKCGICKGFDENDPHKLCPSCFKEFERINQYLFAKANLSDKDVPLLIRCLLSLPSETH